jgi:GNAT superfamily N-acetyltransferase
VALSGATVVGTISVLDIGNAQGALRKMFVRREYRGAEFDVAIRLLDTLIEWCGRRSIREIYLGTAAKFLAAHRFYAKNGFVEIEKSELPPTFPVMAVDTKFYKRALRGAESRLY